MKSKMRQVEILTYYLYWAVEYIMSSPSIPEQIIPTVESKSKNKDGRHCDGGFSELTRCCVYYSINEVLIKKEDKSTTKVILL